MDHFIPEQHDYGSSSAKVDIEVGERVEPVQWKRVEITDIAIGNDATQNKPTKEM